MPAKSQAMQSAAAIAKKVKAGEMKAKPGSPSADMAQSMSMGQLDDFASTSRTGLPKHVPPQAPAPPAPAPRPSKKKERIKVNQVPTGGLQKLGRPGPGKK